MAALVGVGRMRPRRTYTLKVPDRNGQMVPFPIQADSIPDLQRQARILFSHVWDRIEWPKDQNQTP